MNALLYILYSGIKNTIIGTIKTPAKIIRTVVIILFFGFIFIIYPNIRTNQTIMQSGQPADIKWLEGILFVFMCMTSVGAIMAGFGSAGTYFTMSDVNFLFISPLKPQSILVYGLVKSTGVTMFASVFILFQYPTLSQIFDINISGIIILIVIHALALLAGRVVALFIFSVTGRSKIRQKIAVSVLILCFVPLAATLLYNLVNKGFNFNALHATITSAAFRFTPICGWGTASAGAFWAGSAVTGGMFLALLSSLIIVILLMVLFIKTDFYEYMLVGSETRFERQRAAQEGRTQTVSIKKDKKTNERKDAKPLRGIGARVFLSKHLREMNRQSIFGIISPFTIMNVVIFFLMNKLITAAMASGENGQQLNSLVFATIMTMQMQIMNTRMGSGLKELDSHYIYLIPESPFVKMIWANISVAFRGLIEAVFIIGIIGAVIGEKISQLPPFILLYALFPPLLVGINYVSLRFTKASINSGTVALVFMLAVVLIMAPGAIVGMIIGSVIGGDVGLSVGALIVCAWEVIATLICFAASQGILHECDTK